MLFYGKQQDFIGAASALGRASALDSMNSSAHFIRGQVLRRLGEFDLAIRATHAAIRADPSFANAYDQMALVGYSTRRFPLALAYSDTAIATEPDHWQFWEIHSQGRAALKDTLPARTDAERSLQLAPPQQKEYAEMIVAQAIALAGDTAKARQMLTPILAILPKDGPLSPRHYQMAVSHVSIGQHEQGIALLLRVQPRGAWLWSYLTLPAFDPVRADARFVQLVNVSRPPGAAQAP